jgi:hypothetical protein
MYKSSKRHLDGVKEVIDAEAYSGGILERAKDAAVAKNDKYIEDVKMVDRRKCKHHSHAKR